MRQAYAGAQLRLMIGNAALGSNGIREVLAAGERVQMRGEIRIAGTQCPEVRYFPVGEKLSAVSLAVQSITNEIGKEQVYWCGISLDRQGSGIHRFKIPVAVIEEGRVHRDSAAPGVPVTCLVGRLVLVPEVGISQKADQNWQTSRTGKGCFI